MLKIQQSGDEITVEIKVQPRASRNQIIGEQEGMLKIRLTAPPVEGEANQALVNYLSTVLDTPRKNVVILKGESSRHKLVAIRGITREQFLQKTGQV